MVRWAPYTGFMNSATRSEAAAMLMTLVADGFVHIAADSQAAIQRVNRIIEHQKVREHIELATPTGEMSLGDQQSAHDK